MGTGHIKRRRGNKEEKVRETQGHEEGGISQGSLLLKMEGREDWYRNYGLDLVISARSLHRIQESRDGKLGKGGLWGLPVGVDRDTRLD